MTDFVCIMLAFFFLTYIVVERLYYGIKVDSIKDDMKYLWSHYDCTLEDMNLK